MEITEAREMRASSSRRYSCEGDSFLLAYSASTRASQRRFQLYHQGDRDQLYYLASFPTMFTYPGDHEWERIEPLAFDAIRRHMGQITLAAMQEL